MQEKKVKWLISCLISLAFILYLSNFNQSSQFTFGGTYHEECQCYRPIKEYPIELLDPSTLTCSEFAGKRGWHQKVITFTYYEGALEKKTTFDVLKRNYFSGIETNLKLMKELYGSDWTMRLYYQIAKNSPTWDKLCSLVCSDPNIDICDAENIPMYGNLSKVFPLNWRFISSLDPQVDVILVRDLDSNITPREVAAFEAFSETDKKFHIMRDHPDHGVQILGGTWGAKLDQPFVREKFNHSFSQIFKDRLFYSSRRKGGSDQTILKKYIWPWAKKISLAHDSYTCTNFWRTQPFPTQRTEGIGNFVGAVMETNDSIPFTSKWECPWKCRPSQHKDWIYC